jgi:protein-S-isoprenylcysteine O-methyltransferase Ste14
MSHRTADLPPLTGIAHVIRELRYFEGARQGFAVILVILYTITATPIPALAALGLVVGLVGAFWRLYASGFIVKNHELATDGAYRFVRLPLYTGNILLVLGFALGGSRWLAIPLALFFFWFYYPTAIEYEDRKLRRIFGTAWEAWSARTPALMPRLRAASARAAGDGRWSLAVSNTHGELLFVAMALICAGWIAWEAFF